MTKEGQRDTGEPNSPDRNSDSTTNLCNTQTNDPPTFQFSRHKTWQKNIKIKKIEMENGL